MKSECYFPLCLSNLSFPIRVPHLFTASRDKSMKPECHPAAVAMHQVLNVSIHRQTNVSLIFLSSGVTNAFSVEIKIIQFLP